VLRGLPSKAARFVAVRLRERRTQTCGEIVVNVGRADLLHVGLPGPVEPLLERHFDWLGWRYPILLVARRISMPKHESVRICQDKRGHILKENDVWTMTCIW